MTKFKTIKGVKYRPTLFKSPRKPAKVESITVWAWKWPLVMPFGFITLNVNKTSFYSQPVTITLGHAPKRRKK